MSSDMVVTTEGRIVLERCVATFRPGITMVDIALCCRHPTTRKGVCRVVGKNLSLQLSVGTSSSDPGVDNLTVFVNDFGAPLSPEVFLCHLSCDVGDDRAISGKLSGRLRKLGEGLEIDTDLNAPGSTILIGISEQ